MPRHSRPRHRLGEQRYNGRVVVLSGDVDESEGVVSGVGIGASSQE